MTFEVILNSINKCVFILLVFIYQNRLINERARKNFFKYHKEGPQTSLHLKNVLIKKLDVLINITK